MLATFLTLAAEVVEEEESSKTLFYVAGRRAARAGRCCCSRSACGRTAFPGSAGAQRGVIAVSVLLVAATMAASIVTA